MRTPTARIRQAVGERQQDSEEWPETKVMSEYGTRPLINVEQHGVTDCG